MVIYIYIRYYKKEKNLCYKFFYYTIRLKDIQQLFLSNFMPTVQFTMQLTRITTYLYSGNLIQNPKYWKPKTVVAPTGTKEPFSPGS